MFKAACSVLVCAALSGCAVSTSSLPPTLGSNTIHVNAARGAPLCIKLTHGDPSVKAGTVCSGRTYRHEVNTNVCFPTSANPCVSVPKKATVLLTEKHYKGTIVAALSSKKLPKAVLKNPAYPGALCDDKGTASYSEDVLEIHPTHGKGSKIKFTITDFGPRTESSVSVSSDCNVIFYDKSNNVVAFAIIMLTVPG